MFVLFLVRAQCTVCSYQVLPLWASRASEGPCWKGWNFTYSKSSLRLLVHFLCSSNSTCIHPPAASTRQTDQRDIFGKNIRTFLNLDTQQAKFYISLKCSSTSKLLTLMWMKHGTLLHVVSWFSCSIIFLSSREHYTWMLL